VFEKPGILADVYRNTLASYLDNFPQDTPFQMLIYDWIRLVAATFSPTNLSLISTGLSAAAPWVEKIVNFRKLQEFPGAFYLNAYNVDKEEIDTFFTEDIGADHFRAALAFPFLYPPFPMRGRNIKLYNYDKNLYNYIEGSAVDSFNFESLFADIKIHQKHNIKNVIVLDVLSNRKMIRNPKSLYHAWVQSIMVPLVFMAEDDLKIFQRTYQTDYPGVTFKPVNISIPDNRWPTLLDWSRSNLSILYDIGFEAGTKFFEGNKGMFVIESGP
jgi:NTE family protein